MSRTIDLTGQRFGRWLVIERSGRDRGGKALYRCLCDCGTERNGVSAGNLKSGGSKSCGCLTREITGDQSRTHGQSRTPEYRIWQAAKKRCTNPTADNYERYGGRGVTFGFPDFAQFIAEVGPRPSDKHSLDRINNAKGYEPGNVRWATMSAQCRNKRNNRTLTFQGKTQCMTAWEEELGLPRSTIKHRLKNGWSVEEALSTPRLRVGQKRPSRMSNPSSSHPPQQKSGG
jgi:hypothetical protein